MFEKSRVGAVTRPQNSAHTNEHGTVARPESFEKKKNHKRKWKDVAFLCRHNKHQITHARGLKGAQHTHTHTHTHTHIASKQPNGSGAGAEQPLHGGSRPLQQERTHAEAWRKAAHHKEAHNQRQQRKEAQGQHLRHKRD